MSPHSVLLALAVTIAHAAPYEVLGSIDVGTFETSIFLWKGDHYLLENIGCGYIDHFGQWDARFKGHSYARIRELKTGRVIANVSKTIGSSLISAFPDEEKETMWLVGNAEDRCVHLCGTGVKVFWSKDLTAWQSALALPWFHTCNVEIARVEQAPTALPAHRYVMILEPFVFRFNNNADGNLTTGWFSIPSATAPNVSSGGPSIRFENGFYYVITGGHTVDLVRSQDLHTWEGPKTMIQPTAKDATVAPYADFPAQKSRKGFDPMEHHPELWDWNSNDGDVCCHGGSQGAWLVWGASSQGHRPKPPVKHGCTNAIGYAANLTLAELLGSFFEGDLSPELIV